MKSFQLTADLWVAQSAVYGMNVGVWMRRGQACLVDPGILVEEIAQIKALLAERAAAPRYVVITHSHHDHMVGAGQMGAPIVAHERYLAEVERMRPAIQAQVSREGWVRGERPFEIPRPDITLTTELSLDVGGLTIRLVHTPGHAADELALYDAETATLWAGDKLSDVEIPFVSDSLGAYERTLEMLAEYEIRALVPGHGRPAADAGEIQARLDNDRRYLAELRAGVAAAIAQGLTLAETVARCAVQPLPYPGNEDMHRLNVESAYAELGGPADPAAVGWGRAWAEMSAA